MIHLGRWASVPAHLVNLSAVRADIGSVQREGENVLLPRAYLAWERLGVPITTLPWDYPAITNGISRTSLWEEQYSPYLAALEAGSGILCLGCGKGKTRIALEIILTVGVKAAVIVDKSGLLAQWKSAIAEHTQGVNVGVLQESTNEIGADILIISAKTLINRLKDGKLSEDDFKEYGLVIFDECHHFAAPTFIQVVPLFSGLRLGLSATPNREDGRDFLFTMHLGPVFYTDVTQQLIPSIKFEAADTWVFDADQPEITDKSGEVHYKKLCIWLGKHAVRNKGIISRVEAAIATGHHCLVLTHSKEHTHTLADAYNEAHSGDAAAINGDSDKDTRTQIIRQHKVTFATVDVAAEALDAPSLSYLLIATPIGSREHGNILQQALGRIQRKFPGKLHPDVVVLNDVHIGMCRSLVRQMQTRLREWGYPFTEIKSRREASLGKSPTLGVRQVR
jgi:superfamily II DNA or RNA helicase